VSAHLHPCNGVHTTVMNGICHTRVFQCLSRLSCPLTCGVLAGAPLSAAARNAKLHPYIELLGSAKTPGCSVNRACVLSDSIAIIMTRL
jgi:hypothetical protein